MSTVVTITNVKENTLEFDVDISGMNPKDVKVRFVIISSEMTMSFNAAKEEGDTWSVKIPVLSTLSRTAYDYRVEVVVDDTYYFEPTKGVLNVVGTHELRTSTPKNTTLTPKEDKKEEKEETKSESKSEEKAESSKSEERQVESSTPSKQLLRSLAGLKESKKQPKTAPVVSTKDHEIQQILKETATPKKKVITTVPFKKIANKSVH